MIGISKEFQNSPLRIGPNESKHMIDLQLLKGIHEPVDLLGFRSLRYLVQDQVSENTVNQRAHKYVYEYLHITVSRQAE